MNFGWEKTGEEAVEEIQSIKIPNFSVSQCDSLSGAPCSKRNLSVPSPPTVSSARMRSFTFHIVAGEEAQRRANIWHSPPVVTHFWKRKKKPIIFRRHFRLNDNKMRCCSSPKITSKHCFVLPSSHLENVWSTLTHANWPQSATCPFHFSLFSLLKPNWPNSQPQK